MGHYFLRVWGGWTISYVLVLGSVGGALELFVGYTGWVGEPLVCSCMGWVGGL